MGLPVVTVGLCVKNNETSVKDAVISVLNSDYPSELLELIVVDGRSTDRTIDIIKEILTTTKIRYKLLDDGGNGLASARQLVVNASTGKYIQWVDGDHIIPRDFIRKQVDFLESNPVLAASEGITKGINRGIVPTLESHIWTLNAMKRIRDHNIKTVGSAGVMYRLQAMLDVGGYDTNIKGSCEDGDISTRLYKQNWKLSMNPSAFYYHDMRPTFRGLWKEYYWWGYGAHYLGQKHPGVVNPWRFFPVVAFLAGIKHGIRAFMLTKDWLCIFMPIHYSWKRLAWCMGYLQAHRDGYGHESRKSVYRGGYGHE